MERIVEITPAYDKRHSDPCRNYGIHGADLRMILKGDLGAVQFVLFTNWHLPHVTEELLQKSTDKLDIKCRFLPSPADLGYHSPKPMYEGQEIVSESCECLDGKPCYYDGSGIEAEKIYNLLITEGSEAVWKLLEEKYTEMFVKPTIPEEEYHQITMDEYLESLGDGNG